MLDIDAFGALLGDLREGCLITPFKSGPPKGRENLEIPEDWILKSGKI